MRFGFSLRLMGAAAEEERSPQERRTSAEDAEDAGLDPIWVPDHIPIPPDETKG